MKGELEHPNFDESKFTYIKVNLPEDQIGFDLGNGEGIWVSVTNETEDLLLEYGTIGVGRLENQPIYAGFFHLW